MLAYLGACSAMQQLDSLEFSPKSSFYCNLLHISNTQITLLPPHPLPMAPYVGRSWVLCWAILALSWGHLGTMLGFVGSSWAYVGPAWDYVGRSWVLCWAILALCWPILGHVARCSNSTPCNSPQRAVFTVIYSVYCTFPTSKSPDNPPPPPWLLMLGVPGFYVGPSGSSCAYVGPAWDYVGRSWVLCWAILALCWPILGHVARCSNLTPCNSPQRAVFTVIYSVFCTFPTPILTPKSLQITLPPPPPPIAAAENVSAFPTLSVILPNKTCICSRSICI